MAIAKDDRLQDEAILPLLPNNWTTLYELTELDEDALRNAVNDNLVNENMSHGDAKKLKSSKPSKKSVPKSDGKFVKKLKSTSPPRSIKYELKNCSCRNIFIPNLSQKFYAIWWITTPDRFLYDYYTSHSIVSL